MQIKKEWGQWVIFLLLGSVLYALFSALTLLVGWQERLLLHKASLPEHLDRMSYGFTSHSTQYTSHFGAALPSQSLDQYWGNESKLRSQANKQTMYMVPKSTNESRPHYAAEPGWGRTTGVMIPRENCVTMLTQKIAINAKMRTEAQIITGLLALSASTLPMLKTVLTSWQTNTTHLPTCLHVNGHSPGNQSQTVPLGLSSINCSRTETQGSDSWQRICHPFHRDSVGKG